nr:hypothetical protein [Tanacetum cinerariifolium]
AASAGLGGRGPSTGLGPAHAGASHSGGTHGFVAAGAAAVGKAAQEHHCLRQRPSGRQARASAQRNGHAGRKASAHAK